LKGGLAEAMKAKPVRIVLAFYSADEGPTDSVWKSLQRIARVCTVRPDSKNITASCKPYARLRMEGEAMVLAETGPSDVETVVKTLQLAGSPAIFAVNPNIVFPIFGESTADPVSESTRAPLTRKMMLARLREYKSELEAARQDLVQATRLDHALSPAAAWILDNTYLIHTQINEVERHLPRDYSAWANSNNGHGDVNAVAHKLVSKADYVATEASIRECLKEAQTASPFTIAELWAFPLFLRIALIKELTDLATRVNRSQQLRESAYLWANRLASSARTGTSAFEAMLRYLETEPIARQPHFVTALAEQLHDEELALGRRNSGSRNALASPLWRLSGRSTPGKQPRPSRHRTHSAVFGRWRGSTLRLFSKRSAWSKPSCERTPRVLIR